MGYRVLQPARLLVSLTASALHTHTMYSDCNTSTVVQCTQNWFESCEMDWICHRRELPTHFCHNHIQIRRQLWMRAPPAENIRSMCMGCVAFGIWLGPKSIQQWKWDQNERIARTKDGKFGFDAIHTQHQNTKGGTKKMRTQTRSAAQTSERTPEWEHFSAALKAAAATKCATHFAQQRAGRRYCSTARWCFMREEWEPNHLSIEELVVQSCSSCNAIYTQSAQKNQRNSN